jgi:Kef-type K+ transport system membrane component KefB
MTNLYFLISFLASVAFFVASSWSWTTFIGSLLSFAAVYILLKVLSDNQRLYHNSLDQGQHALAMNDQGILNSLSEAKRELKKKPDKEDEGEEE